jgi:ssDNA thymidine ADP-ribosyltransferase, DarT
MTAASNVPADPAIYHITHVNNLPGIVRHGGLWCDSKRIAQNLANTNIGYAHIKQRRLSRTVDTSAGGMLGDYVPFNFCYRSVMLFVISRGHKDYSGGQDDVVHLVSSMSRAVALGRAWAFTDRHAEVGYAQHFDDPAKLSEVPWHAMPLHYWQPVSEERQAEFLVHDFFDWHAVAEIVARTPAMAAQVQQAIRGAAHQPGVAVRPDWYY